MTEPYPVGTRVHKINSKLGDTHPDGARGVIVTQFGFGVTADRRGGYFVVWEDIPGVPVFVGPNRVEPDDVG